MCLILVNIRQLSNIFVSKLPWSAVVSKSLKTFPVKGVLTLALYGIHLIN